MDLGSVCRTSRPPLVKRRPTCLFELIALTDQLEMQAAPLLRTQVRVLEVHEAGAGPG